MQLKVSQKAASYLSKSINGYSKQVIHDEFMCYVNMLPVAFMARDQSAAKIQLVKCLNCFNELAFQAQQTSKMMHKSLRRMKVLANKSNIVDFANQSFIAIYTKDSVTIEKFSSWVSMDRKFQSMIRGNLPKDSSDSQVIARVLSKVSEKDLLSSSKAKEKEEEAKQNKIEKPSESKKNYTESESISKLLNNLDSISSSSRGGSQSEEDRMNSDVSDLKSFTINVVDAEVNAR